MSCASLLIVPSNRFIALCFIYSITDFGSKSLSQCPDITILKKINTNKYDSCQNLLMRQFYERSMFSAVLLWDAITVGHGELTKHNQIEERRIIYVKEFCSG